MIPLLTTSPLFPYTTLFRSGLSDFFIHVLRDPISKQHYWVIQRWTNSIVTVPEVLCAPIHDEFHYSHKWKTPYPTRSEEHTSELQSHSDLVCRLLLEKKNHK